MRISVDGLGKFPRGTQILPQIEDRDVSKMGVFGQ